MGESAGTVHQKYYAPWILPSGDQDGRGSQFDKFSCIQEIIKLAPYCQLPQPFHFPLFLFPNWNYLTLQAVLMACTVRLLLWPAQNAGVCIAFLPKAGSVPLPSLL